jgi:hypothetical protein
MKTSTSFNIRRKSVWIILSISGVAVIIVLALVRLISGQSLGLRSSINSLLRPVSSPVRAILDHSNVTSYSQGEFTNIVFLHHSTGRNLINQGGVREAFIEARYTLWDHDYNQIGLRDPSGQRSGYDYRVPDDNTNPDGLAEIVNQRLYSLPLNTFSSLMQHEVIMLKSCYPVSDIGSDEELEEFKEYYLEMRSIMDQHPDKIFILLSQPPLNPARTNPEIAARARAFADWLESDAYLNGHPNVYTFNLFGYLAENEPNAPDYNMLRSQYRNGKDSHPNRIANESIGPNLVEFVIGVIEDYRSSYSG